MPNDFRWGGISLKKGFIEVLQNMWMVIAAMIITYLGIGILTDFLSVPLYSSTAVIAVYPFNTLYNLDASTDTVDAAMSVDSVFNSALFQDGLEEQIGELEDRSFWSTQIKNSNMLMLEARSPSSADAYKTVRGAIEYYKVYSEKLPGSSKLEIISQPDVSYMAEIEFSLLQRRALLTLLMGFAMGCFLVARYLFRKTYKSERVFRNTYKNTRIFSIPPSASKEGIFLKKRKKRQNLLHKEMLKKAAIEIRQMLRSRGGKSLLITSAIPGEGKTEFSLSAARELSLLGLKTVILEANMRKPSLKNFFDDEAALPEATVLDLLKGKAETEEALFKESKNLQIVFSENKDVDDDFIYTASDVGALLKKIGEGADIVLILGDAWKGSKDVKIWQEAADAVTAMCRQDRADFFTEDRMMDEVCKGNTYFMGSILAGFE